ncbi:MAG: hypothetical protein L0Y54_05110 [Sporichthyaceae bacterium]|nr:hypothetical protein [Sporichthyaceae bacterium]
MTRPSTEQHRGLVLSRRGALALAGAGAAGLLIRGTPGAQAHGTLYWHNEIWSQPTHRYNGGTPNNGSTPTSFQYNAGFYSQVEAWLQYYYSNTPGSWLAPIHLWLSGTHVDKTGSCGGLSGSCHSYARAIDFNYVYMQLSGSTQQAANCDYLWWNAQSGSTKTTHRKRYWAFVASLNYHFRDVLHYWYTPTYFSAARDFSHQTHVHADNGVSGSGLSTFPGSSSRTVQNFAVQSCLTYIWNLPVTIDGYYGTNSKNAAATALSRIGRTGPLTNSANWRAFLTETVRAGSGGYTP